MILNRLKLWLSAAGAFVLAVLAAYMTGRSAKAREIEHETLSDYQETRGRMDEVGVPDSVAAARGWLLNRGKSDRDL